MLRVVAVFPLTKLEAQMSLSHSTSKVFKTGKGSVKDVFFENPKMEDGISPGRPNPNRAPLCGSEVFHICSIKDFAGEVNDIISTLLYT